MRHVLQAFAIASLAMTPVVVMSSSRVVIGLLVLIASAVIALSIRRRREKRTRAAIAAALEGRYPHLQNVVVTAEELLRHPARSPEWIRERVFADAAAALRAIDPAAPWPLGRVALGAAAALTVAMAAIVFVPVRTARAAVDAPPQASPAETKTPGLDVFLTPPPYTHRAAIQLRDPERLEVLEGTAARVTVTNAADVRVRLGERPLAVTRASTDATAEALLTESGYLAIESRDATGAAAPLRLLAVTVVPDLRPSVRIEQPARDLLLPDARASVAIAATVTDDISLTALQLHYTKVSGAGEEIDFVEGELPLQIARQDDRHWQARGSLALRALGLEPGDSLVYRVTARDARAGDAGVGSSEMFFIEIAGPGQVPLEGIEMPPEQERYALSQQMIVVKINRLRERERNLSSQAVEEETNAIAAEQRSVRASFIFLTGGHVEDEEEEAEQSSEIQEGRLENTSRREMSRAVSHMTAAEQGLTARDTGSALKAATLAVEALQRAFSRNRYILRTLASRTRLDPSRRLTGARDDVQSGEREIAAAAGDPEAARARALLVQFLTLMAQPQAVRASAPSLSTLSEIAESALAVKPGDRAWKETADAVVRVRDLLAANADAPGLHDRVRDVVRRLTAQGRRNAPIIRPRVQDVERVESAWAVERRRR